MLAVARGRGIQLALQVWSRQPMAIDHDGFRIAQGIDVLQRVVPDEHSVGDAARLENTHVLETRHVGRGIARRCPERLVRRQSGVHHGRQLVVQAEAGDNHGIERIRSGDDVHADLAWSYDSPFRESAPIAGLVAFYDELVDLFIDDERQTRPKTRFV